MPVLAAETPIPPPPTQWVTDTANFMSPGAARELNARLEEYERSTGHVGLGSVRSAQCLSAHSRKGLDYLQNFAATDLAPAERALL